METVLTRLGQFVATLDWQTVPEQTRRAARYQVLNVVAAVHAAAEAPEPQAVARGIRSVGASTVLATGARLAPGDAAAVNAAYAMTHDFDDIIWMGHTCHSAVFASLAMAEHVGASAEAMLAAVVAANEVSGRLAASCLLGPLNGQMTTYLHALGAAAAAARLLGLDAEQTTHAMAVALAQPTYALQPAFMRPTSKLLSASVPIQIGVQAAFLAASGLGGDAGLIEDPRGFWQTFAFVPLPCMFDDLGSFWAMQTLTMKAYPGCHYFQTACEALAELGDVRGAASVTVDTQKMALEVNRFGAAYAGHELTPVNVNFDLATSLAVMLHAGRLTPAELDAQWLRDNAAAIGAWSKRVTVRHDPALTLRVIDGGRALPAGRAALRSLTLSDLATVRTRYRQAYVSELVSARDAAHWAKALATRLVGAPPPEQPGVLPFPSRVTVRFASGREQSVLREVPSGCFLRPSALPMLRTKFMASCSGLAEPGVTFANGLALEQQNLAQWIGGAIQKHAPSQSAPGSAQRVRQVELG